MGSSSSLCLGCALLTDDLPVEEDSESDGEEGIDLHEDFGDGLGDHDDDGRAWATGRRTSTAGQGGGGDGDDSMEDSSDGEEVDRLGPQFELHNFVPPSVEKVSKARGPTTLCNCFCRPQYLTTGRACVAGEGTRSSPKVSAREGRRMWDVHTQLHVHGLGCPPVLHVAGALSTACGSLHARGCVRV